MKKTGRKKSPSVTSKEYLIGCEIEDIEAFFAHCREKFSEVSRDTIDYLSGIYGTELDALMDIAKKDKKYLTPLNSNGDILAQVVYAVKYESACTLNDILFRRTGIGTLGHPGKKSLKLAAETAGSLLGWNSEQIKNEIKESEKILSIPKN